MSDFNPFNFEYDVASREIFAACSLLFEGAELYWSAGALNWSDHLGHSDYQSMCIFHANTYKKRNRQNCANEIRNKKFPFTQSELINQWNKWFDPHIKYSLLIGYGSNTLPHRGTMQRYYDKLPKELKQSPEQLEIVRESLEAIDTDETIDDYVGEITEIVDPNAISTTTSTIILLTSALLVRQFHPGISSFLDALFALVSWDILARMIKLTYRGIRG